MKRSAPVGARRGPTYSGMVSHTPERSMGRAPRPGGRHAMRRGRPGPPLVYAQVAAQLPVANLDGILLPLDGLGLDEPLVDVLAQRLAHQLVAL